ncbi:MAG: hypothetical protein HY769_01900 [Candidatus Stahlbacteria bacterium]|nr:hypothetical protein [Candidatus Stahlbacteria bacterium]
MKKILGIMGVILAHKAEGVIGLMDFVKGQKDSVRPPEAVIMAAEVTYTDSANNNQDTTLVTPFAFYFNERPQNVEYELFAANEPDTVWIGQVWQEKAQEIDWGEFGRCFFRGATMACLGCAYGCRVTATGYFHCLGGCCGVFAVLSALDCAWQQWWDK